MYEFIRDKAKDIVDVNNADKQFKIFDSDNNLIIEGKGSDIYGFLTHANIIVEFENIINIDSGSRIGDCHILRGDYEEDGILHYRIRLPYKFSRVEGNTVYVKRESIENSLKDKISFVDTHPKQTFNVRKTAVLTSLFAFLFMATFITGNVLMYYTNVNIVFPWLFLFICIITFPFMLYYILKLDRWMYEK